MENIAKEKEALIRLDNPNFPEEWIMSVVAARNVGREDVADEGLSHIYGTQTALKELLEANPAEYLGAGHAAGEKCDLGVLVKIIDSSERLTIQAHPDIPTARALFSSPHGKTECWHILGGREINGEKPCIYLGFKRGVTRERWKELFDKQDLDGMLDSLERFDVKAGDTILIEGGMPHAIGAGCFLVEIQEPTDFTIRVERTTPSGFAVDDFLLGFDKMFDVFHYEETSREEIMRKYFIKPSNVRTAEAGESATLVGYENTPMFRLDELRVSGSLTVPGLPSFSGLYVLRPRRSRRHDLQRRARQPAAHTALPRPARVTGKNAKIRR